MEWNSGMTVEEMIEDSLNFVENIRAIVKELKDDRPKVVGDRVRVWDGSYSEDLETGEHYDGNSEIMTSPFVLIETGCNNPYAVPSLDIIQDRDVVIYSPSFNKKIVTSSEFLQLMDDSAGGKV